jgi:hypothetical protein
MKKYVQIALVCFIANTSLAQISGEFQSNTNFFIRDTNIKASGNPLYDNYLSGGENWLALRYSSDNGFNASVRFDAFHNSNLLAPLSAYNGIGLGTFNISKEWDNLTVTAGHIYDQVGSGIVYRAYEDRGLLIDNALFGVQAKYKISEQLNTRVFAGNTRNLFDRYKTVIKGAVIEGDYSVGKKGHITPGIGIINKTINADAMNVLVGNINALDSASRFVPKYNSYALSVYNTLNSGNFSLYTEAAFKTSEAILNQIGNLDNKPGSVYYANGGWSRGKLGFNASIKRTENFVMRTGTYENPLRSFVNWQPVIAVIRPQRTIARYTPASQDLSEQSGAVNGFYTPNDNYSFNASYTLANTLDNKKLYRELFADAEIRSIKKTIVHTGIQVLYFNQFAYQNDGKDVKAVTPFAEITYKISEKRSLKADLQYMSAEGDFGSWMYALLEYNIAPKWAFALGDMYNTTKGYNNTLHPGLKTQHYPNVFIGYTKNAHRFTAQYVKQVAGINCTGGVCRYEPAFSGFKLGMTSSF